MFSFNLTCVIRIECFNFIISNYFFPTQISDLLNFIKEFKLNNFEILRPFGPPIGKFTLPKKLISIINNYVDEISKNTISTQMDVGQKLSGQVSHEIFLPEEIIKGEIVELFAHSTSIYLNNTLKKKIKNFQLLHCWVVRQFKNEYNPVHWHSGHISAVGWLKVPENFGPSKQEKKYNPNGKINFIHGSKQFLSNPRIEIEPKIGDMCIFPHYLMHEVYPFNSEGERRSISFNAILDNELINTF